MLSVSVTVVIEGAPGWSAAGPGRAGRAPWVVWGHVDTVERAFSASLAHLGLRTWSIHSNIHSETRIWSEFSALEPPGDRTVGSTPLTTFFYMFAGLNHASSNRK